LNRFLAGTAFAAATVLGIDGAEAQISYYVGGQGGLTILPDQTDTSNYGGNYHVEYDPGFNVGVRGGIQWWDFRFEGEYSYTEDDNRHFVMGGVPATKLKGNRHSHALMSNVLYDFPVNWPVTPHIGFGVGELEVVDRVNTNTPNQVTNHLLDFDWVPAAQAIAGLRYDYNRFVSLELDYRFLTPLEGLRFHTADPLGEAIVAGNIVRPKYIGWQTGYDTQNIVLSVVFRCCAAAPAPPP